MLHDDSNLVVVGECRMNNKLANFFIFSSTRIVRNKAAEKAKHVHHQQQSQNSGTPPGHLPQSPQMTATDPQDSNGGNSGPNSLNGTEGRISSGYSINGILGIQHSNDPNVNNMKRKRVDDHASVVDGYPRYECAAHLITFTNPYFGSANASVRSSHCSQAFDFLGNSEIMFN
ncbi:CLUMA_CG021219, isoform A [Clunio marinus]|uniref:CLUMA_CG021219, isoform A n=1 Tax=Clunio marinus TaxID=568069 RepID=A0A1J1J885_9DIPT|nr:CLUMA_CG021219, isoform A [Clunio marinus]